MLEELLNKYDNIDFICKNKNEAYQFVDDITQLITFQITANGKSFVENKEYIEHWFFKHLYNEIDNKIHVLVCKETLSENPYTYEYRIYTRNQFDYGKYNDWDKFKEINYSNHLKIKKLLKLKEKINEKA